MDQQCPLCPPGEQRPRPSTFRVGADFIVLYIIGIYELIRQWCYDLIFCFSYRHSNVDPFKGLYSLNPVIVCTGVSSGIGRHILGRFTSIGLHIIALTHELNLALPNCCVEVRVDFNSPVSTVRAAKEVSLYLSKLKPERKVFLLQCAGVFYPREQQKSCENDPVSQTLNVNFVMPCVFLHLLDEKIDGVLWIGSSSHSVAPRIVHATCPAHIAKTPYAMYPLSKLLSVVYMEHWSKSCGKPALVIHPGVVATCLYKGERGLIGVALRTLLPLLAWNPAHSAQRVLKLVQQLRFYERVQTCECMGGQSHYDGIYCDAVSMTYVAHPPQIQNQIDNACIGEKLRTIVDAHVP